MVLSRRVCSEATRNTHVHICTRRVRHTANNSVTSDPSPQSPLSLPRSSAGQHFCLNSISPTGTLLKFNSYLCLLFRKSNFGRRLMRLNITTKVRKNFKGDFVRLKSCSFFFIQDREDKCI